MDASLRRKVVAGTVAALAVGGAGAGIAATQLGDSPSAESKAIVNDAAKQLGIQHSELSGAIKKALSDRVDAAVKVGRLTKDEETRVLKDLDSRIDDLVNGQLRLRFREHRGFDFGGPGHHGVDGVLPAAFPGAAA